MTNKKIAVLCGLTQEKNVINNTSDFDIFCGEAGVADLTGQLAFGTVKYSGIISWGTAGGLDPEVKVGELILASSVQTDSGEKTIDNVWANHLVPIILDLNKKSNLQYTVGKIYSTDEAAETAEQKAALFTKTNAICIDEESWHAANLAQQYKLPFLAIRAISDAANQTLPDGFNNAAINSNGSDNMLDVLKSIAKNPFELISLIEFGDYLLSALNSLTLIYNASRNMMARKF